MRFIGRLLCLIGLHSWERETDTLGCYGMGLEWFECWHCRRCPATADRLRGCVNTHTSYQSRRGPRL